MNGLELVQQAFSKPQAAFMPYFPVGFPDLQLSIEIMAGLAAAGADLIEVGVPFSDPLADGPTVQYAGQVALANGVGLPDCLDAIAELRRRGVTIPLMLMSYANPFMAYGEKALVADAVKAGASGFIVPDLPADEAGSFQALVDEHQTAIAYMLAPTSSPKRIELAAERARGFIYLVSVAGVTGARDDVPPDLREFIARVRAVAKQPLAVGFGIGSPQKAQAVAGLADGVIIGSKLVTLADESPQAVLDFALAVRVALDA